MGSVVTFYSYKGGVGRTMALANVATLLAGWGKRVLVVDWDLEAPGLEHFFFKAQQLEAIRQRPGLIDLLAKLEQAPKDKSIENEWKGFLVEVQPKANTQLHLLTAGARGGEYFRSVRELDIKSFYEQGNGGYIVERLRSSWKSNFDFILIDSRTGITDIGGICTIQLPDVLAVVFTTTEQSLCGAVEVANKAAVERQKMPFDRSLMPVLPLPGKFDTQTEHEIAKKWLNDFERAVSQFYKAWLPTDVNRREFLELTKIPYVPYFSFGESLPVLAHGITDPTSLGYAYETIAAVIGNELQDADLLLESREEFIRLARVENRIPRIPLRDVPSRAVVFFDVVGSTSLEPIEHERILGRFQHVVMDMATRHAGTVAMHAGDSVLLAFSDPVAALRCAVSVQEVLAVSAPIITKRGPLRARIAIHGVPTERGESTGPLLEEAVQIANKTRAGQVLISDRAQHLVGSPLQDVTFRALDDQIELSVSGGDFFIEHLYEVIAIVKVTLTTAERDALLKQDPASKHGGGFQAFLVKLQSRVDPKSNELILTIEDRERIARYAHDYRSGGWQARLRKILGRTLGANLGRQVVGSKK